MQKSLRLLSTMRGVISLMHLRTLFPNQLLNKFNSLTNGLSNHLLLILRIGIVGICLIATFGVGYPPASAQRQVQNMPVITVEDAIQDDHIEGINKHLEADDRRADNHDATIDKIVKRIDDLENYESKIIGGLATALAIIGLMTGCTIVIQVRQKQA
jgi:hypothetical protein